MFFCTFTAPNLLFEPKISVCILVAICKRYWALCIVAMYVCMCLKVSVKYGQLVRIFVFCLKKIWLIFVKDSKGLVVLDLWLKLWHLWTVRNNNRTLFWESLFLNFNKKGFFFLLKQMVKNPKNIFKKILLLLKWQVILTFKVKIKAKIFYKESPTIKNSVIYNDLAIQIFFFSFILELKDLNFYFNVASSKL